MNNFIELLQNETISVIEGLTGHAPKIQLNKEESISESSAVSAPLAIIEILAQGASGGKISLALAVSLATALGDLMLGGEGEEQSEMSEDDLDATKEIVSNIFGALATSISAQQEMPQLSFEIQNISFLAEGEMALNDFYKLYTYDVSIASTTAAMIMAVDKTFISNFEAIQEEDSTAVSCEKPQLSEEELKNISLIMDVELPVRVRIGTKTVLLKDVLNMDIGSIVELDQLANEPLDVLIGDKVIAKGEVIIVDGNFGVQIVEIDTPQNRLNQLR
jgi:flagellar motor switch protein FliN/FliY